MAKPLVGIDIGNDSIRAVELADPSAGTPQVTRYGQIGLPPGAAASGEVLEPLVVAAALRQLWTDVGFKTRNVVLGMGNQRVLVRDLVVPRMTIEQIRESLPFQVQEMLPVPVDEAILDFYPVAEVAGDGPPQVSGLLVAAVKENVLANIRAVEEAGLTAVAVDLIPFALVRAQLRGQNLRGTVALIDVGATTTNVVIVTDGVPNFVRIIPAGGEEVTKALSARLEIAPEIAERAKRQVGISVAGIAEEHRPIAEIASEVSGQLLNGIRNTIHYFVVARNNTPVDRIVLSGGGARLPGFGKALAEFTQLPATTVDPFGGVSMAKPTGKGPAASPAMAVALGLALGAAA